jgi:CRISPR/Cas system-associated exonuclease Cas4 (RecB family)
VARLPGLEPQELGQVSRMPGLEPQELGQVSRMPVPSSQLIEQAALFPGLATPFSSAAPMLRRSPDMVLQVSEILDYKTCGRFYYWRRKQDLAEPVSYFAPGDGGLWDDGSRSGRRADGPGTEMASKVQPGLGTRIGIFVHQLARARVLDMDWPELLWKNSFPDMAPEQAVSLQDDLQLIWRNLKQSSLVAEARRAWDEVPFWFKMAADLLITGRFDRLVETSSGALALLDYKTHRIAKDQAPEVAVKYFWQLQLYALAVQTLWGRLPDQALLFFVYPNELVPVPLDEQALMETQAEIQEIARFVATHNQLRDYPQTGDCYVCGYREWCGK